METASIVAADSAAALGLIAARLGENAVLLGVRSHARGVELTAASPRVAPAIARFAGQARRLGFSPESYAELLATLAAPVSPADLWVRFVARIERLVLTGPLPEAHLGLLIVGPPEALTVAQTLAGRRQVPLIAVGRRRPAPRKPPPTGAVFVTATADIAEARAIADAARNARVLVVLSGESSADWAGAFADAAGAMLVEDLNRPGFGMSALLATALPLCAIAGADDVVEARASRLCRGIVVALGRLGAEDRDGESR